MDENYFKPKQLEIIQTVTNFIKEEKKFFQPPPFKHKVSHFTYLKSS